MRRANRQCPPIEDPDQAIVPFRHTGAPHEKRQFRFPELSFRARFVAVCLHYCELCWPFIFLRILLSNTEHSLFRLLRMAPALSYCPVRMQAST